MSYRLAHLSDLHYHVRPGVMEAASKRALGLLNLYVKGRVGHFSADVADKAIAAVLAAAPDGVAITGDLSALATEAEFVMARERLDPLLSALPTFIIPGNHDYYTRGAQSSGRIERYFRSWMQGDDQAGDVPIDYPAVHRVGALTLIGMNPCRATLGSSGMIHGDELERLRAILAAPREPGETRVLMIHYPLVGIDGEPVTRWTRRLNNREGLMSLLEEHPVEAVLHGHDHVRYHNRLTRPDGGITYIMNAGSAAFAPREGLPVPASFNIYELGEGALSRVQHFDLIEGAFRETYDGPPPVVGPTYNRLDDPTYGPDAQARAASLEGMSGVGY